MAANSRKLQILLGQVIGTKMRKTAKVSVQRLVLDKYILQYFPENTTAFAHDPHEDAKEGDIVLIQELPFKRSKFVKYRLDKVIHRLGNVVDPFSGKKCDLHGYWKEEQTAKEFTNSDVESKKMADGTAV